MDGWRLEAKPCWETETDMATLNNYICDWGMITLSESEITIYKIQDIIKKKIKEP